MSPFAFTIPFRKIVPKIRNTNWVSAKTVIMNREIIRRFAPNGSGKPSNRRSKMVAEPKEVAVWHYGAIIYAIWQNERNRASRPVTS
jgi:hypothetical protein